MNVALETHEQYARRVYSWDAPLSPERRRFIKTVRFGLMYGQVGVGTALAHGFNLLSPPVAETGGALNVVAIAVQQALGGTRESV